MIHPRIEASAQIHIHAATAAVWQHFQDVGRWHQWHPQVRAARWVEGAAWQEGAHLGLNLRTPLGFPLVATAVVRMAVPAGAVVWESALPGIVAVHTVRFEDDLGGCRVQEREVYHGMGAAVMAVLRRRQQQAFSLALTQLKELVEGLPRR